MDIRRIRFALFAAIVLLVGCQKNESAENAPADPSPHPRSTVPAPMQTVARVHWLGMKQISHATNAASLMAVWNLPESRKLEQQTLDKSSLAPWRLLHRSLDTNAAARLRPLLDDVVSNESCLEIRQATNQPSELVFAIRLDDQRAGLWETNLAQVLESLTGIHPVPAPDQHYGWSLKKHHTPNFIELTRAGDWTLLGAAEDQNGVIAGMKSRIQHGQAPLPAENTNDWLTADLDPAQLIPRLGTWNLELGTWNHFHLTVTGNGTNVLTHGQADFSQPLALDLKAWNAPTNLINWQLCSFTAVRGLQPWLKSWTAWNDLKIGPLPDQIYFWALQGTKMHSYFAAPLPDASNEVARLTDFVLHQSTTNSLARFVRSEKFNGLGWKGLPYMWPFLRSISFGDHHFVYGGGFSNPKVYPVSDKWLHGALGRTNLVYYDTEASGPRVEQWIYMSQFARYVSHHAQLPFKSPAMLWLKAISPKLGYSVTQITETRPDQLSFSRHSNIGFTGIELNLLADWLESPQFPIGLHTFLASPPKNR